MCEKCYNPQIVLADVFGNADGKEGMSYDLVIATQDTASKQWMMGEYALLYRNHLVVSWDKQLPLDPLAHLTEDEICKLDDNDPIWEDENKFRLWILNVIQKRFVFHPETGHTLYQVCLDEGFDRNENGNFLSWLMRYISRKVVEEQAQQ